MTQIRKTIFHNPTIYLQTLKKINLEQIDFNKISIQNALKIIQNNQVDESVQKKKCDEELKFKYIKLCQFSIVKLLNEQAQKVQMRKKQQLIKKKKNQIEQQSNFIQIMKKQVREERAKLSNIMKKQKTKRANSIRNEPQNSSKNNEDLNLRKTVQRSSSISKPCFVKDQDMDMNQTIKNNELLIKPKVRNFKYAGKSCQSQKAQNRKKEPENYFNDNINDYEQKIFGIGQGSSLKIEKKNERKKKPLQIQQVEDIDLDMPLTLSLHSIKQLKKKKQSEITFPPNAKLGSDIKIKITSSTLKDNQKDAVQNQEDYDFQGIQLKQKSTNSKKSLVDVDVSSQQEQQPYEKSKEYKNLNESCKIMPTNLEYKPSSKFGINDSILNRQIHKMDLQSRKRLGNKLKQVNQFSQIVEEQDLKATVKSYNPIRKY